MASRFSGRRLREIRRRSGLSREALAVRASTSVSSIVRYETNRSAPSLNGGVALAEVLGVGVAELLDTA